MVKNYVDCIQVRANSLIHFLQPATRHGRCHYFDPTQTTYSGKMTDHTRKRLQAACDILVQRTPAQRIYNPVSQTTHDFRLAFMTLTQPPDRILDARQGYDLLLKDFLRYMRQKEGLRDYIWKFERQQNGQAHWHLATAQYIRWEVIRWAWNTRLRRSGQLEGFAKRYGHFNPNSTDIHNMVNIEDCLNYLGKEICKTTQNKQGTKGKIWDCSKELKRKRYWDIMDDETMGLIDDAVQMGFAEIIESDHCRIFKMKNPLYALSPSLQKSYHQYIFS